MRNPKNQNAVLIKQPKLIQVKQPSKVCICGACDPPKSKLPPGMRRIKVQQKCIAKVRSYKLVPVIMLSGNWLRKSGFEYQNHVIVVEKKGQLIIKLDTAQCY